jgi:hypothetical protein
MAMNLRRYVQRVRDSISRCHGNKRPGKRPWRPQVECLETRTVPSTISWTNRGQASDNFATVFGTQADTARGVVDAAIAAWQNVIQNFNYSDGSNTFSLTVSMDPTTTGLGASASVGKTFDAKGKPMDGGIVLNSGSDGHGKGYFLDPTPHDSEEFRGTIVNGFAANATPGGPADGLADLYTVTLAELTHAMGLFGYSKYNFLKDPNGYLRDAGQRDAALAGELWTYTGPDVHALLTSDDGGADFNKGNTPRHDAEPNAKNSVTYQGSTYYGVQDVFNASYESSRRYLVSDLAALILQDSYGYTVNLPSSFYNMYINYDSTTGNVLLRGGSPGEQIYSQQNNASDDTVTITEGSLFGIGTYRVSVTIGNPVPGAGPNRTFIGTFVAATVNSITVDAGDGNDKFTLDFSGGKLIPSGGISYDGGTGNNQLVIQGGSFGSEIYSDFPDTGISLDGSRISYQNVQSITDTTSATDFSFGSLVQNPREIDVMDGGTVAGVGPVTEITSGRSNPMLDIANKTNVTVSGDGGNVITVNTSTAAAGLNSLTLDSGTGNDTMSVEATAPGVPVTINSGGGDTVTVGFPDFFRGTTLAYINGPVSVRGGAGSTKLIVDDSGDAGATTGSLDDGSVRVQRPHGWVALVGYRAAALQSLDVKGGNGGNTFTVSNTPPAATTTIDCGPGGDTVNVRGTSGPLVIEGNGSSGTVLGHPIELGTTVNVGGQRCSPQGGGLDHLHGAVAVRNRAHPSWHTDLTVDDRGGSRGRTGTLGAGAIDLTGLAEINYGGANLSSLDLLDNSHGGNNLTVTGTGAGYVTALQCGADGDTVNVQVTTGELDIVGDGTFLLGALAFGTTVEVGSNGSVQGINGAVSVTDRTGVTGVTDLSVDDSADPTGRQVTVTNRAVTALAPAPITYQPDALSSLTVTTGSPNTGTWADFSDITVLDTPSARTRLNVGTNFGLNNGGVYVAGTTGPLDVYRHSTLASQAVRVEVGNSSPTGDGSTLANVKGPVSFYDTAPKTWVVIEDASDTVHRSVTFSDHDVSFGAGLSAVVNYQASGMLAGPWVAGGVGGTAFTVTGTAPGVGVSLLVQAATSAVANTVNVLATSDGGVVQVRDFGGVADTITVGSPTASGLLTLANIHGHVFPEDDLSHTDLVIDDRGDTANHDWVTHPGLNLWNEAFNGFDLTDYYTSIEVVGATKDLRSLTIYDGSGANSLGIQGLVPGTATAIHAEAGTDTIFVGRRDASGLSTVKTIQGPLAIYGRPGVTTLTLDDSGSGAADRVTITPTQVGAAAGDNFFGPGGTLTYSGIDSLTVDTANTAGAMIALTPSATTAFFINAGSRPQGTLILHLAGVTGPQQTVTGSGSGYWGFLNRRPVSYAGILDMETTTAP